MQVTRRAGGVAAVAGGAVLWPEDAALRLRAASAELASKYFPDARRLPPSPLVEPPPDLWRARRLLARRPGEAEEARDERREGGDDDKWAWRSTAAGSHAAGGKTSVSERWRNRGERGAVPPASRPTWLSATVGEGGGVPVSESERSRLASRIGMSAT